MRKRSEGVVLLPSGPRSLRSSGGLTNERAVAVTQPPSPAQPEGAIGGHPVPLRCCLRACGGCSNGPRARARMMIRLACISLIA